MSGIFDPNTFLDQQETGASSTYIEPIPAGEYTAVVRSTDVREIETKRGKSQILDITWELQDQDLKVSLDRESVTARQSVFLDLTPEMRLDMGKGKNVQLGRVREALGQNDPGRPWSVRNLLGAGPVLIRITQRADDNDTDRIFNDVKAVSRLS